MGNAITDKVSMDDIADMIMPAPEDVSDDKEELPDQSGEDLDVVDEIEDEDDLEDVSSDDDDEGEELEDEDDAEELSADADDEDEEIDPQQDVGDDEPYLDISDDDMFEVKIDGEIVYKTVAEAKAALSGDGAVQKRLKEATELRNQHETVLHTGIRELEEKRTAMSTSLQQMAAVMLQPTVAAPDNALRVSDPARFLAQQGAWEDEQRLIQHRQAEMSKHFTDLEAQQKANLQQYRDEQNTILTEKLPNLRDPEKAKVISKEIRDVTSHFGISPQEVAGSYDHRLFLMAYAAAQHLKTIAASETKEVTKEKSKRQKMPRRLRSGVARKNAAKNKARRKQQAVNDKARKSGKIDDIAAAIMK